MEDRNQGVLERNKLTRHIYIYIYIYEIRNVKLYEIWKNLIIWYIHDSFHLSLYRAFYLIDVVYFTHLSMIYDKKFDVAFAKRIKFLSLLLELRTRSNCNNNSISTFFLRTFIWLVIFIVCTKSARIKVPNF